MDIKSLFFIFLVMITLQSEQGNCWITYPNPDCDKFKVSFEAVECNGANYDELKIDFLSAYKSKFKISGTFEKFSISPKYKSLTSIELLSPNLKNIDFSQWAKHPKLTSLTLNQGNIGEISLAGISLLTSLERLSLSGNRISEVKACEFIRNATNLTFIDLSDNELKTFDISCLPVGLESLTLRGNQLTSIIQTDTFSRLPHLKTLDLSRNHFTNFGFGDIPKSLDRLLINGNRIENINFTELIRFNRLNLAIGGNPLQCSCSLTIDYYKVSKLRHIFFLRKDDIVISCKNGTKMFSDAVTYAYAPNRFNFVQDSLSHKCLTDTIAKWNVPESETSAIPGCRYGVRDGLQPKMQCRDITDAIFPFRESYEAIESLDVEGSFETFTVHIKYKNLLHLRLRSPKMTSYNFELVPGTAGFHTLDLADNQIRDLKCTGGNYPTFRYLKLDNNFLKTIGNCLRLSYKFEELSLAFNRIENIDLRSLPYRVDRLILNNNRLTNFTFKPCGSPSGDYSGIHSVFVDLRENTINCDCEFARGYFASMSDCGMIFDCGQNGSVPCFQCEPGSKFSNFSWRANKRELVSTFYPDQPELLDQNDYDFSLTYADLYIEKVKGTCSEALALKFNWLIVVSTFILIIFC